MANVNSLAKNSDLRKKILFTLMMLAIYRIGVHIPTPGVDGAAVMAFFDSQNRGIFGMFNMFTGGALAQFSVFALGIMPYISASIIFSLLTSAVPYLEQLKKEGEHGRKKINQYTRYATIVLAVIQGYGISTWLMQPQAGAQQMVTTAYVGFISFRWMTVITLTAGTCFVMWLGEQITERGIGVNGSSLIIFTGIAASIPSGAMQLWELVSHGEMKSAVALALLILMVLIIAAVIYMETAQRRITIQYSQRAQVGMQSMTTPQSYLPVKINISGVIPPIFASSLLMFPATVTQFVNVPWLKAFQESMNPNGVIFNVLFVALIVFFAFFYTEIVFNPNDVADNLKKSGAFIPGVRSGKSTSEFIQRVLDRVNVLGCVYLASICILPGLMTSQMGVPFHFGGTSLLILVGVALDTAQHIQQHFLSDQYRNMTKGAKIRSRRVQF